MLFLKPLPDDIKIYFQDRLESQDKVKKVSFCVGGGLDGLLSQCSKLIFWLILNLTSTFPNIESSHTLTQQTSKTDQSTCNPLCRFLIILL